MTDNMQSYFDAMVASGAREEFALQCAQDLCSDSTHPLSQKPCSGDVDLVEFGVMRKKQALYEFVHDVENGIKPVHTTDMGLTHVQVAVAKYKEANRELASAVTNDALIAANRRVHAWYGQLKLECDLMDEQRWAGPEWHVECSNKPGSTFTWSRKDCSCLPLYERPCHAQKAYEEEEREILHGGSDVEMDDEDDEVRDDPPDDQVAVPEAPCRNEQCLFIKGIYQRKPREWSLCMVKSKSPKRGDLKVVDLTSLDRPTHAIKGTYVTEVLHGKTWFRYDDPACADLRKDLRGA